MVVPSSRYGRTFNLSHQNVPEIVVDDKPELFFRQSIGNHSLMPAVKHQTGDFILREFCGEIFGALERSAAPVFIDIEVAVAVEVLEDCSVDFQKFYTGFLRIPQTRAIGLFHGGKSFGFMNRIGCSAAP